MTYHAIDRIKQRYGVAVSMGEIRALVAAIRRNEARYLGPARDGAERWLVHFERINFDVPVVFDPRSGQIVTVLCPLTFQALPTAQEVRDAAFAYRRRGGKGRGR